MKFSQVGLICNLIYCVHSLTFKPLSLSQGRTYASAARREVGAPRQTSVVVESSFAVVTRTPASRVAGFDSESAWSKIEYRYLSIVKLISERSTSARK